MQRRRGEKEGYGAVTKLLHWLTVLFLGVQFFVGYAMDAGGAADRAEDSVDAFEERNEESEAAVERREVEVERLEDHPGLRELTDVLGGEALRGGLSAVEVHVLLGLTVLALGLARLVWRRATALPPWAAHLSAGERTFESRVERALLALLLVVPGSGLLLVLGGGHLLPLHVTAQVALLVAAALHVGLVLKHTVVRRNRHLSRML